MSVSQPSFALVALVVSVAASCTLGESTIEDTTPVEPEALPSVQLSGQTIDYFSGEPVGQISLETLGLSPEQSTTAGKSGKFAFDAIPEQSFLFLRSSASETHTPTLADVNVGSDEAEVDAFVVSTADVQRQHATVGVALEPGTTMVVFELVDFAGEPLPGVPRSDLVLTDEEGTVVASEPFVFGALGDVDEAVIASEVHFGAARFAFLNIEPGFYQLELSCSICEAEFPSIQAVVATAGVTLTRIVAETLQPEPDESTYEGIVPLLAKGSDGGLGCANCHTAGGSAPIVFDGVAREVHEALLARPGVIDTANPDASLLLSKPLYELPANHPNATFLNATHADYLRIRNWIAAGAP